MATDQGKTSNMNALAIVSPMHWRRHSRGRPDDIPHALYAGDIRHACRRRRGASVRSGARTPIHDWAEAQGAVFEDVGLWKRARYFPRDGEDMHAAVARECTRSPTDVGLFDASTLGKIEVVGPDAAEFLNRIYTNWLDILAPGRSPLWADAAEDGYMMDDGSSRRLAADRFHVTTTTGGAARVLDHMEDYLQTEWPDLEVWLTSVTEQWASIAVQGPKARDVIAPWSRRSIFHRRRCRI